MSAGIEALDSPWGFNVAMDVDGLVHVEQSLGPPAQGVEDVVCVFGAEPG